MGRKSAGVKLSMEIEPRDINDVVKDIMDLQKDITKALTSQDKTIATLQEVLDVQGDIIDLLVYRIGKLEDELE